MAKRRTNKETKEGVDGITRVAYPVDEIVDRVMLELKKGGHSNHMFIQRFLHKLFAPSREHYGYNSKRWESISRRRLSRIMTAIVDDLE
tara:strand:+ start:104 stop:370 length:267 start_codon:yes stop_codon:yes gene_type:complete